MRKKILIFISTVFFSALMNLAGAADNTSNLSTSTKADAQTNLSDDQLFAVGATAAVAGGIIATIYSNHQTNNDNDAHDALDIKLQTLLDDFRTKSMIPGVSMSVSLDPKSATRNYTSGKARLNSAQLLNSDTIFQAGSNTKAFTSAIILQLEAEGKLNTNDTVGKYLPNRYPNWNNVTLLQLLEMTSSIQDYFYPDFILNEINYPYTAWSLEELVDYVYAKNPQLLFPSGSQYYYSNTGYFLLGMVIEKITGNSYTNELYSRLINNPQLGLTNIYYIMDSPLNYPDYILNRLSFAYFEDKSIFNDTFLHDVTAVNLSAAGPTAGIISTPKDFITWMRDLYGGKVLPITEQNKMQNECIAIPSSDPPEFYCLGITYYQDYKSSEMCQLKGKMWTYIGSFLGQGLQTILLPDNTAVIVAFNAMYKDKDLTELYQNFINSVLTVVEETKGTCPGN